MYIDPMNQSESVLLIPYRSSLNHNQMFQPELTRVLLEAPARSAWSSRAAGHAAAWSA
jgi:hypothetical protein